MNKMQFFRKTHFSPASLIRIILGGIFIFSGIAKALSPGAFSGILNMYDFLPAGFSGLLGILVPWLEIAAGLWLVLGFWPVIASFFSLGLVICFFTTNIYAIFFGGTLWNSQCGCFGQAVDFNHIQSLALNVVMLAFAVFLILYYSRQRSSSRIRLDFRSIRFAVSLFFVCLIIALPFLFSVENSDAAGTEQKASSASSAADASEKSGLYQMIDSSLYRGQPVFLYFYDSECLSCQQQKPVVTGLEKEYGKDITFIFLESTNEPLAMSDFDLPGVPAMALIYNKDNSGQYKYEKYLGATAESVLRRSFSSCLSDLAAGKYPLPENQQPPAQAVKSIGTEKSQSTALSGSAGLEQVWKNVLAQGSYRFEADIDEQLKPRPVPAMIGQSSQRAVVELEGDVSLPDKTQVTLSGSGPGLQIPRLHLVQDGGNTFVEIDGKVEPYRNQVTNTIQVNDYTGYLAAAENVRLLGTVTDGDEQFTRYAFIINGSRLSAYLKEQFLSESGIAASVSPVLMNMNGRGEVLVDSSGLPRKQILDLEMPASTAEYDALSHVEVKYFDFGEVKSMPSPVFDSSSSTWALEDKPISPAPVSNSFSGSRSVQVEAVVPVAISDTISGGQDPGSTVRRLHFALPVFTGLCIIFILYIAVLLLSRTGQLRRTAAFGLTLIVMVSPSLTYLANDHVLQASAPPIQKFAPAVEINNKVDDTLQKSVSRFEDNVQAAATVPAQCGDGEPGVDSDNDGLDDPTEYCLGTNPFSDDSDLDNIADIVEVAGFNMTDTQGMETHWPGDPLHADSNMDGMLDTYEWPESEGGTADSWDTDNDGIPNPWDSDNDNDSVPDDVDLSPYSTQSYEGSIPFTSENKTAGNAYQYIDVQVVPEASHLNYSRAVFNWPDDDKGNIQDLDGSTDDMRLIPTLAIKTNITPEKNLAKNYGISVFDNDKTDTAFPYLMYAPLTPVKSGKEIKAYQTRVAYDPASQADIRWKFDMVWMVDAKLDEPVGSSITYTHVPVQVYPETNLRLSGLQVIKSGSYESAILGTPEMAADDKELFNLAFGMSAGFLNSLRLEEQSPDNTMLQEIKTRFSSANTPADPYLWGLKTGVKVDLPPIYSHEDAAIADLVTKRTAAFLKTYYIEADTASLLIAHEETAGSMNMDSLSSDQPLHFNLSAINMTTGRGMKLQMFGRTGNTWTGLTYKEMLDVVRKRYADTSGTLDDLHQTYPELTGQDIFTVLLLFYTIWGSEQRTLLDVDGMKLVTDVASDQEIFSFLNRSSSLPGYLISVGNLAKPGGGLLIGSDTGDNWEYIRASEPNNYYTQIKVALGPEYGPLVKVFSFIADGLIPWDQELNETYSVVANSAIRLKDVIMAVKQTYSVIKEAKKIVGSLKQIKQIAKTWTKIGKGNIAMCVISVGMTWASFALFTDFSDPVALGNAISLAIVETVVAVALTVIACNPVGAVIAAVLAIVDLIVYIATWGEFSFMAEGIAWVAKFFYRAEYLTELKTASFSGADSSLQKYRAAEDGLVVGNRFVVSDQFVGTINKTSGSYTDLWNSGVYGTYSGGVSATGDASFANNNVNANFSNGHCTISGGVKRCTNSTGVIFEMLTAKPNVAISITGGVSARTRYKQCVLWAFCWRKNQDNNLPESPEPATIYLDVLPATVEGFFNWDLVDSVSGQKFNPALGSAIQPDPWQTDSDEDGLSDGVENRIGTFPDKRDSDGDGLSDGEEVFHQDPAGGQWSGGWEIHLLNNASTRVFSNPLMKDTDNDGLNDKIEMAGALSPNAYHSGPRLTLLPAPLYATPEGKIGVYIKPGDNVDITLKLFNGGADPISSVLDFYIPSQFSGYQGGDLSGDRRPAKQVIAPAASGDDQNGTRLSWDFSGSNALLTLESVSTTIKLASDSASSNTVIPLIIATLSIGGAVTVPVEQTVPVSIDVDGPAVAFTSGTLIGGGITDYVIGGSASDTGSWVARVDLTLPGETATAAGTNEWAHTWNLPSDGVYTLTAQATDYFGHAGTPVNKEVTVDNTPPQISITSPAQGTIANSSAEDTIDIVISGIARDKLSHVSRVQISLNNRPWQSVNLTGFRWTYHWVIPGTESAQGKHSVRVRAFDNAHNQSDPIERTVVVDVVPPTSELSDRTFMASMSSFKTGEEITISGVTNDAGNVPQPSRPAEMIGDVHSIDDATIWFEPASVRDSDGGIGIQWLGDFNGDRLADLAIGLPAAADGAGRVSIIYGMSGGWAVPPDGEAIAGSIVSFVGSANAGIGNDLAAVGDVNGDGFDDLLIGDKVNNRAHLVFGRPLPAGKDQLLGDNPRAGLTTLITLPAGYSLEGVGPAGDINGDSIHDIFITTGGESRQTHLIPGGSIWLDQIDAVALSAITVELSDAGAYVSNAADLDGDGFDDFILSVPGKNVYLFYGNSSLTRQAQISYSFTDGQVLNKDNPFTDSTMSAVLGDVNGDGRSDLALNQGNSVYICSADEDGTIQCATAMNSITGLRFIEGPGNVHDLSGEKLNDVLIGSGQDALLYTGWETGPKYAATFTGVLKSAGSFYAAGSDFNADGSSDLILIPDGSASAESDGHLFGQPPAIDQQSLPSPQTVGEPIFSASSPGLMQQTTAGNVLYVDDDGICANNMPCYDNIQAAADAASSGDEIVVYPGVYSNFTITMDYLSVRGMNPDAVFIDGNNSDYAIKISAVPGIRLANMTLRNAINAVLLEKAGVGGYEDLAGLNEENGGDEPQGRMIILDRMFIHDCAHALHMDRVSTALVKRSTITGLADSSYIEVDNEPDPLLTPAWTVLDDIADTPANSAGSKLLADSEGALYSFRGGGSKSIWKLESGGTAWNLTADAPWPVDAASAAVIEANDNLGFLTHDDFFDAGILKTDIPASKIEDVLYVSASEIYIVGDFDKIDDTVLDPAGIACWNGTEWTSLGTGDMNSEPPTAENTQYGIKSMIYIGNSASVEGYDLAVGSYAGVHLYDKQTGNWKNLPGFSAHGPSGPFIEALALNNNGNRIFAGGNFDSRSSGEHDGPGNGIAYWDFGDDTWHMMGLNYPEHNGVLGRVESIVVEGDNVFIGGLFTGAIYYYLSYPYIIYVTSKNVIVFREDIWDTTGPLNLLYGFCWHALDHGVNGDVRALALYQGASIPLLVIGGTELSPAMGEPFTDSILGYSLDSPGFVDLQPDRELNGTVNALGVSGQRLYAGGSFNWTADSGMDYTNLASLQYDSGDCQLEGVAGYGTNGDVTGIAAGLNEYGEPALYAGGSFTTAGGARNNLFAEYANSDQSSTAGAYWFNRSFYAYSGTWNRQNGAPFSVREGTVAVSDGTGQLYAVSGGNTGLYRYDGATWNTTIDFAPVPAAPGKGAAAAWANGALFLLRGGQSGDFFRYDAGVNSWNVLSSPPYVIDVGAGMAWDGGNYLYVLPGGGGPQFLRYNINSDAWQSLSNAPSLIRSGAGLVRTGNDLFATKGGGFTAFWKYSPLNKHYPKLVLDEIAFVAPAGASSAVWLNLDPSAPPEDFDIVVDNTSIWAGGKGSATSWEPGTAAAPINLTAASFLDSSRGVYRLTSDSPFTAGYHQYTPDAVVSTSGCEGCFASIQAAIDSNANQVIVQSGNYTGDIYLVSGVTISGSGASSTVIRGNGSDAMIKAVGVRGAALSGLTLKGNGAHVGLHVKKGSRYIVFSRSVVTDTVTAIVVDGADSDLEVFNNTIVNNVNGMTAGNKASIDVRNTIFAYNSRSGLVYDSEAAATLHNYNLYWANSKDLSPGEASAGELFMDPLFIDRFINDFRTKDASPVIDAGDPGDPAPPGTGGRADIGYLEQGRASFYADDDYCAGCLNDGLTWGVDAFDTIQEALDAADSSLRLLDEALAKPAFTVGVAPGIYAENVIVPGHVSLIGSGAEKTAIRATKGTAITFNGVEQASVQGFSIGGEAGNRLDNGIRATGSANNIEISRNLLQNSDVDIAFDNGASGIVQFNTLVSTGRSHLEISGERTWAEVRNNILAGGDKALSTENGGRIFNSYNLLWSSVNYADGAVTGLKQADSELITDPEFAENVLYRLTPASPAVDAADPFEPVTVGGGTRADMGYFELTSLPISLFMGDEDISLAVANSGVTIVEYGVIHVEDLAKPVEETVPQAWNEVPADDLEEIVGDTVVSWNITYTPGEEGLYRIYSRAYDKASNVETMPEVWYNGAFLADASVPAVSWISPAGTISSPAELRAEVSDYVAGDFNVEQVYFEVNGKRVAADWAPASWNTTLEEARTFRAWVSLDGDSSVQAFAVDRAGNAGASALIELAVSGQNPADEVLPGLSVTSPLPGAIVKGLVEFRGTAFDNESGLAGVQISLDGGSTWIGADIAEEDAWMFDWASPDEQEFVSFPVKVRAIDNAGNIATWESSLTIDNQPPWGLDPVGFSVDPGLHLSAGDSLTITWQRPADVSGQPEVIVAVDTAEETMPEEAREGNSLVHTFTAPGLWYIHVGARDPLGNELVYHSGPWYVGDALNQICSKRKVSILVDGVIDVGGNEWSDLSQRIGDDERPTKQQVLYAAWDAGGYYLAWRGAQWQIDGTLWAYFGTGSSGSAQTVEGTKSLPFNAGYAVEVQSPEDGKLWQYTGERWAILHSLDFAQGESGETEIRLPFGTNELPGEVFLLAFAVSEAGEVWSVFPTTNPLTDDWNDSYHWANLCAKAAQINQGQSKAYSLDLAITSPQQGDTSWAPGTILEYAIAVTNREYDVLSGFNLTAEATDGLTFISQSGAGTCLSCAANTSSWNMTLPDLSPGAVHTLTLYGKLAAADILAGLENVTASAILKLDDQPLSQVTATHRVDGKPPELEILFKAGQVIGPGKFNITGNSDDGDGSGIALIEWREYGSGEWKQASGTGIWSIEVNVTGPNHDDTFDIELRGTDINGNVSSPWIASFAIDNTPPAVQFNMADLPPVVGGYYLNIGGTASDSSTVSKVEIRLDDGGWVQAPDLFGPNQLTGIQNWLFTWDIPVDDSSLHEIAARATDAVGNTSDEVFINLKVDTIGPDIHGVQDIGLINLWDYVGLEGRTGLPVLSGTASDDSGLERVEVTIETSGGKSLGTQTADLDVGGSWNYTPLLPRIKDTFTLVVNAVDGSGNAIRKDRRPEYSLAVLNTPPIAAAGGPYIGKEGMPVALSAAGTTDPDYPGDEEISRYEWDIDGDGVFDDATGKNIQAKFADNGNYTVSLRVTDIGNLQSTNTATVSVENVAPTVKAGADITVNTDISFSSSGSFSDPGADTWNATVDYGDGSGIRKLNLNEDKTYSLGHSYSGSGTRTVTVAVTDDDGGTGKDTVMITIKKAGSDSGGGGGGIYQPKLYINIGGIMLTTNISESGVVQQTINAVSPDKVIDITIPAGTAVLTGTGSIPSLISIAPDYNAPDPPTDSRTVGKVYKFEPNGTTFSPPATLIWSYDPEQVPSGIDEARLRIAFYDITSGDWKDVDANQDVVAHKCSFKIGHFSTFALLAPVPETTPAPTTTSTPVPPPEPTKTQPPATGITPSPAVSATPTISPAATPTATVIPTPEERKGINPWIIIGPVAGLVLVGLLALLIMSRRNKQTRGK